MGEEYMMHMTRRWREGDVYTPHDLSGNEMRKWKKRIGRTDDVFDLVGVNPLDHYRVSILPTIPAPPQIPGEQEDPASYPLTRPAELLPDFRLHLPNGPHNALEHDGSPPSEPAQDRQDRPTGHGHGHPPQRPPAPRAHPAGVAS